MATEITEERRGKKRKEEERTEKEIHYMFLIH